MDNTPQPLALPDVILKQKESISLYKIAVIALASTMRGITTGVRSECQAVAAN